VIPRNMLFCLDFYLPQDALILGVNGRDE